MIVFKNEEVQKFFFTGELNAVNIVAFFEDVSNGRIQPTLKSEAIPEHND